MNNNTDHQFPKLKIGLIVDASVASKHIYDMALWAQKQPNLSISCLIVQKQPIAGSGTLAKIANAFSRHGVLHTARRIAFAILVNTENFFLQRSESYREHLQIRRLDELIPHVIPVTPRVSPSGLVYRYEGSDLQRIKDQSVDLLIRCGSGILRGEILSLTRLGVISIHHGDNRVNRGGPPGFWEVYLRQHSTGFVIQQLNEELDGGKVLFRGRVRTRSSFLINQAALYLKSYFYLRKLLSETAASGDLPAAEDSQPYCHRLFSRPTLTQQLAYLWDLGRSIAPKIVKRTLLRRRLRWGVAFSRSDWKTLVMWRANRIKNPPNHFLADPFVISEGKRDFCFVEDYDYQKRKGCISVYELNERSAEKLGDVLAEPFHLSFPYVFRYDGKFFMCPDSSANKDIRLYECVNFPLQWKLAKILMPDVSAADSLIFEHGGLWWLFTNIDSTGGEDHSSELFAYFADTPLGAWTPHPKNPLLIDGETARNGGILFDQNWLYRVSQKQEFRTYGKSFLINRISVLSKEAYSENAICKIEARFFSKLLGAHHLHSNGAISVFDFVEETGKTH